jgi:hypothetical protein
MKTKHFLILLILLAALPVFAQNGEFLIDTSVVFNPNANEQGYPAVAYDGANYLVVWQDNRSDTGDIYAARVDPTGAILDPSAFAVSAVSNLQSLPAVVFDCGSYFAVWQNDLGGYCNICGSRVTPDGLVMDTSGIQVSPDAAEKPAVSSDGTCYFVVWIQQDWWSQYIHGARVFQSWVLDTASIVIQGDTSICNQFNAPSIAFDSTNYFVVYCADLPDPPHEIVGKRVHTNGIVLDTNWIDICPLSLKEWNPTLAYDGSNYLAAWQDHTFYDICGGCVTPSGIVLDSAGFSICVAPDSQTNPCIAFNGTDYIVAWEDWRNGAESDIYGARVSTSGTVLDSFVISNQAGNQLSPAITHGLGNQMLITYSGWTDSINGQPVNTMRIWGKFYPELGIHEDPGYTIHDTRYNLMVLPNPLSRYTNIRFMVHDSRSTEGELRNSNFELRKPRLEIYDATGRSVKSFNLESWILDHGSAISWRGDDNAGRKLPSGVYFVKFVSGDYEETEKVLLIR